MDNAKYHSVVLHKSPTSTSRKSKIETWLKEKYIKYSSSETRPELFSKVRLHKEETMYELDMLANEREHEIICLLPYHCQYNPCLLYTSPSLSIKTTPNLTGFPSFYTIWCSLSAILFKKIHIFVDNSKINTSDLIPCLWKLVQLFHCYKGTNYEHTITHLSLIHI